MGNDFSEPSTVTDLYNKERNDSFDVIKEVDSSKLEAIPERLEWMDPELEEIGKVIARLVEVLHEKRQVRKEAKELRKKLSKLPMVVRSSYFKMLDLKSETNNLGDKIGI